MNTTKTNINFFVAITTATKETVSMVLSEGNIIKHRGGVNAGPKIIDWRDKAGFYDPTCEESRKNKFFQVLKNMFKKGDKTLHVISDEYCQAFYAEILSDEIKNNYKKFHAVIEQMEEGGKIFPRNLSLIHMETVGGKNAPHEKIFYKGVEYIYPKITKGKLNWVFIETPTEDAFPENGTDFFCQDEEVLIPNYEVSIKEVILAFEAKYLLKSGINSLSDDEKKELRTKAEITNRFGRLAHRVAFKKIVMNSGFFLEPENKDLIYKLDFVE